MLQFLNLILCILAAKLKKMNQFYPLKIKEIIRETPGAVSLSFEIPNDLKEVFHFVPGQYVTIKTKIEGEEVRRSYSLCSAPNTDEFKVTVKEVDKGRFSAYANNKLKAGDTLEVHPPEGKFTWKKAEKPGVYVAFAAGSGITPVMSILKSVLNDDPHSKFVLVYGNKTAEDTIFFKELLELQSKYPDRLFVEFFYSRKLEENSQFGRIEKSTVNYIIKNKFKDHTFEQFYLCGPEEMILTVKDVLLESGVYEENIKFELFTSSQEENEIEGDIDGMTQVTIILDEEEHSFSMDRHEVVLDKALDHDIDAPFSCQGGICSSCMARITEGKAEMSKNQILTDEEIEEGFILTCQAHPTTPTLKVDYDDI